LPLTLEVDKPASEMSEQAIALSKKRTFYKKDPSKALAVNISQPLRTASVEYINHGIFHAGAVLMS